MQSHQYFLADILILPIHAFSAGSFVALALMDKLGRKALLLWSFFGMVRWLQLWFGYLTFYSVILGWYFELSRNEVLMKYQMCGAVMSSLLLPAYVDLMCVACSVFLLHLFFVPERKLFLLLISKREFQLIFAELSASHFIFMFSYWRVHVSWPSGLVHKPHYVYSISHLETADWKKFMKMKQQIVS